MEPKIPIVIVAGIGKETRAIGKGNELLWHVPDDLKRFKELTLGHPIIMGRKTFESIIVILGKPLPGRTTIVITRDNAYTYEGVMVTHSLSAALAAARALQPTEIHIGGGAEIYQQVIPMVTRLHLTYFFDNTPGDAYFPEFAKDFVAVKEYNQQSYNGLQYQWVDLVRKDELYGGSQMHR